jgi:hypothetical protein
MLLRGPLLLLILACGFVSGQSGPDPVFEAKIQPILKRKCLSCHNEKSPSSGFSTVSRNDVLQGGARQGKAVQPGKPQTSVLVKMLRGDLAPRMPLGGEALPEHEIQTISSWIEGLKPESQETVVAVKRWWSFEPVRRSDPPQVVNAAWAANGIDRFILQTLAEKKLAPAPEASKQVLMRRAYFDLLGVPPTPQEANAFLGDQSPGAWAKLIDQLLADPRYGERWGRYWLDLARYADSTGYEGDIERPHMWRYRDYVIDAFNKDKPYNQFILEQLAGDEFDEPTPESLTAPGFLRLGAWFAGGIGEVARYNLMNEMTGSIGAVFLGLTVKCAQCHNHKYDPIPQKDYYRLQAFLTPVQFQETKLAFSDAALARELEQSRRENQRAVDEFKKEFAAYEQSLLAKLALHSELEGVKPDPRELRNRMVRDDAATLSISKVPGFTDEEKERYLDMLDRVERFPITPLVRDHGWMQRRIIRAEPVVHTVDNYRPRAWAPGVPTTHIRIRGDYNQYGERVEPGVLSAVTGNQEPSILPADRSANILKWRTVLANWIASPENPLTARVLVNRIWQHHFGEGIVLTPSDFGRNGARPSHPELLDWLSHQLVENKWSMKAMHRLIMNSSTYRQTSSHASKAAQQVDPANRLLWKMHGRRLEGEAVRDSILVASGRLNPKRGGPGVFPKLPEGVAGTKIKNRTAWIRVLKRRHAADPSTSFRSASSPTPS